MISNSAFFVLLMQSELLELRFEIFLCLQLLSIVRISLLYHLLSLLGFCSQYQSW